MSDHACPACGYIHPNMDEPAEQVRALYSSDITSMRILYMPHTKATSRSNNHDD